MNQMSDCDVPIFYTHKTPKARKEHECCECGGLIKVGERYQSIVGFWEEFGSYKICQDCHEIRSCIRPEDPIPYGGLKDEVFYHNNEELKLKFIEVKKKRESGKRIP